jgi:opacity protein-like surface antigen
MARRNRAWLAIAAAAVIATVATPAGAAAATPAQPGTIPGEGWFLGVGLGSMSYVEPQYTSDALSYIYIQGGWRFNAHLALDGRVGTDLPGDCGCGYYYRDPYSPKVRSLYGLYLRGTIPLSTHLEAYALAGYASLTLDAFPGLAAAGSAARSASFGVGLGWKVLDRGALDLELLPRMAQGEGWRTDALNIGFRWRL